MLCPAASICPPVLTRDHAIYGGLDGKLYVVPLAGGEPRSFATAFGAPITAPVAVADGRIYVPLRGRLPLRAAAPDGKAPLPTKDLEVTKIRSPLTGPLADAKYDWYTNYGDFGSARTPTSKGCSRRCGCAGPAGWKAPSSTCRSAAAGGCTRTRPKGQIIAVEQDTGRLLWRRYWPDVYLSFTSPLYVNGKLLVPQAGMKQLADALPRRRHRQAAVGSAVHRLAQLEPAVPAGRARQPRDLRLRLRRVRRARNREAVHVQGHAASRADGREVMSWIYSNDNPYYPKDNRPLLWAWDLDTGKVVWQKDFSEYGRGGNDCGICLLDGKLFYSTFFGYSASQRARRGLPPENNGLTACLDPQTGDVVWQTNKYYVTAKCTLTGTRRPHLHRRLQPGQRRHQGPLRVVSRRQGRLARLAVRPGHLRPERRHRRRAVHLLQRPARPRQRLRPRRPARSSAASITTTPAAASRCPARTSSARTWT